MSDTPALTLDQFATITVWLRAGTKRERALAEAEIDTATWLGAQIYWLGRMASLVANGDSELHNRFLDRTAALESEGVGKLAPRAVADGAAPVARLAPLRAKAAIEDVESAPSAAIRPAPELPPLAPTVVAPPLPATEMSLNGTMDSTIDGPSPWAPAEDPAAALPFVPGSAPIQMVAVDSGAGTTAEVPAFAPAVDATPFDSANEGKSSDHAADAGPSIGDSDGLNATLDIELDDIPALPFVHRSPAPPAEHSTSTTESEQPPAVVATTRASSDDDGDPLLGTIDLSPEEAVRVMRQALGSTPFRTSEQPRTPPTGSQVGGTPFKAAAIDAPVEAADLPPADDAPPITLEQYAWLFAAIQAAPEQTEASLAMLSLKPQDKVAIDRHFEALFKADSRQRQAFLRACMQYRKQS